MRRTAFVVETSLTFSFAELEHPRYAGQVLGMAGMKVSRDTSEGLSAAEGA